MSGPHRLRAPHVHGAVVAEPPLADVPALLAANRELLGRQQDEILGRPSAQLRREARETAAGAARSYLIDAREPVPDFNSSSLIMAGHQPELFHPGVWVKNFALHHIAQAHGGTPINLVVDNDTAKSTSLRVPVLTTKDTPWPHVESVPFDHWSGEVPYEERKVLDEALFATLPARVAPLLVDWGFKPLLIDYWEEACRQSKRTRILGERLVAARRTFERRWGCHNLELPVSLLCQTEPFGWFACHLLANLQRFHAIYNACVHDYRGQYGIRSRNHPVPDLAVEGDWLEVPLWAWRAESPQRGRLLARQTASAIELRVGPELWPALPLPGTDARRLVNAWQELERRGLKVRSRALTNTLYARVFLAELFIHGIGGGKYDELTDAIARQFYGWEPPAYLVLSATLLLPLPTFSAEPGCRETLARELRDLHCNPQRHLVNGILKARELAVQKTEWIARPTSTARERRERFKTLRSLTDQLRPFVRDRENSVREAFAQCDRELQANAVLQNREYAFCLYPESLLRSFCTRFLV